MARGREVDPFTALIKAKLKEKNLKQIDLVYMLDWSESKVSSIISGKNYHKGPNQSGVYHRKPSDVLCLAVAIDPSPEFIQEVVNTFDPVIRWFTQLRGCKSLADVEAKAEEDGVPWFEEQRKKDELPDKDE